MADYEFKYSPLTGRLTGKQMIEQTEQAINALASQVDSAAGQVEIISTLANEANENAATALETAEEALATTGRTYLTVSTQTDANNYYDSQLIYIADSTSTNIPVEDTGMLEAKTNDSKTACEQCFVADSSGASYYRHGDITAETVGDVTTYTVTWGGWSSQPASQTYVQQELTNYLPLSGGTVTGGLTVEGTITGNLAGNANTATNATNDANGNPIAGTYLPLAGGTMTGKIIYNGINSEEFSLGLSSTTNVDFGWDYDNGTGAMIGLRSNSDTNSGEFEIFARNASLSKSLIGKPDGTLTWAGKNVLTDNVENVGITTAISFKSGYTERGGVLRIIGGTFVQLKLGFNITSNVTAGTVASIGTLASAYRPPNDAFGGSIDGNLYVLNNGDMQFRFFLNKSAGSWTWCTVCYLLK